MATGLIFSKFMSLRCFIKNALNIKITNRCKKILNNEKQKLNVNAFKYFNKQIYKNSKILKDQLNYFNKKGYNIIGFKKNKTIKNMLLKNHPIKLLLKVLIPFKGLRKNIRRKIQDSNISRGPPMSAADKKVLKAFYKEDVKKLSILLKRDLNYWTE